MHGEQPAKLGTGLIEFGGGGKAMASMFDDPFFFDLNGFKGYNDYWLNESNAWTYRHLRRGHGWSPERASRGVVAPKVHVSTRSPMPASPANLAERAVPLYPQSLAFEHAMAARDARAQRGVRCGDQPTARHDHGHRGGREAALRHQ